MKTHFMLAHFGAHDARGLWVVLAVVSLVVFITLVASTGSKDKDKDK